MHTSRFAGVCVPRGLLKWRSGGKSDDIYLSSKLSGLQLNEADQRSADKIDVCDRLSLAALKWGLVNRPMKREAGN